MSWYKRIKKRVGRVADRVKKTFSKPAPKKKSKPKYTPSVRPNVLTRRLKNPIYYPKQPTSSVKTGRSSEGTSTAPLARKKKGSGGIYNQWKRGELPKMVGKKLGIDDSKLVQKGYGLAKKISDPAHKLMDIPGVQGVMFGGIAPGKVSLAKTQKKPDIIDILRRADNAMKSTTKYDGSGVKQASAALAKIIAEDTQAKIAAAKTTGANIVRSGGLSSVNVANAAKGKLTSSVVRETVKLGGGRVMVNTYTARTLSTYLRQVVQGATSPKAILAYLATGLYTSFFWAPNEKGDALTTGTITMKEMLSNKDYDSVLAMGELMDEANAIKANLPMIGFGQAEVAKFDTTMLAKDSYVAEAIKQMKEIVKLQEQARGMSSIDTPVNWEQVEKDRDAKDLKKREENRQYYEDLEKDRDAKDLKKREDDRKYYADIEKKRDKKKAKERKEDTAYWDNIREENKERKDFKSDYDWEKYKKSQLNFGLLK